MTEKQKPPQEPDRVVPPIQPDYNLITHRQKAQPDPEETFKRLKDKRIGSGKANGLTRKDLETLR